MFLRRKKNSNTKSGTQSNNPSPKHSSTPRENSPNIGFMANNNTSRSKKSSSVDTIFINDEDSAAAASVAAISRLHQVANETLKNSPDRQKNQLNDGRSELRQSDIAQVLQRLRQTEMENDEMREELALKDEEIKMSQQQLERLSTMIVELTMGPIEPNPTTTTKTTTPVPQDSDAQELLELLTSAKMELATQALDHEQHVSRLKRNPAREKKVLENEVYRLTHDLEEAFVALDYTSRSTSAMSIDEFVESSDGGMNNEGMNNDGMNNEGMHSSDSSPNSSRPTSPGPPPGHQRQRSEPSSPPLHLDWPEGKYSSERAAREWSTVVDISSIPPCFNPISLSSPRSPLFKTPKQVFI